MSRRSIPDTSVAGESVHPVSSRNVRDRPERPVAWRSGIGCIYDEGGRASSRQGRLCEGRDSVPHGHRATRALLRRATAGSWLGVTATWRRCSIISIATPRPSRLQNGHFPSARRIRRQAMIRSFRPFTPSGRSTPRSNTSPKRSHSLERASPSRKSVLRPGHVNTLVTLDRLAMVYREQGKYTKAEPLYLRAVAIHERKTPDENLDLADTALHYAALLRRRTAGGGRNLGGPRPEDPGHGRDQACQSQYRPDREDVEELQVARYDDD